MSKLLQDIEQFEKRWKEVDALKHTDPDAWGCCGSDFDFIARQFLIDNADAFKDALEAKEKLDQIIQARCRYGNNDMFAGAVTTILAANRAGKEGKV
jgi:hypothetical protein